MNIKSLSKEEIKKLSETGLRKKVIIPLVEFLIENSEVKNYGVYKVESWHGRDEKGIDVYFGYTDLLGRDKHYGIQVKIKNIIKNNTSAANNIKEIENQANEAYKRTFVNPITFKGRARIDGFYIFTSGKISKPARSYLDEIGFPNIDFFDVDDIMGLQSLAERREKFKTKGQKPPKRFLLALRDHI